MSCNYRIIKVQGPEEPYYGLFEVHYDENGFGQSRTETAIEFVADAEGGPADIIASLNRALDNAKQLPVLEDVWPQPKPTPRTRQRSWFKRSWHFVNKRVPVRIWMWIIMQAVLWSTVFTHLKSEYDERLVRAHIAARDKVFVVNGLTYHAAYEVNNKKIVLSVTK